ncbi:MAG: lysophospholipid acyltransferase family protein [Thermoanaerobaculia bacterium]|nr:lysophospholipid acyltransferase family protein [Thermoanaerobaculia bacterium]
MSSFSGTATGDTSTADKDRPATHDREGPPEEPARRSIFARLFSTFHVYGVFWYKLHLFGVRNVPPVLYRVLVPLFAFFFFCTLIKIRGAIARNLEAVLGPCTWWETQKRIWRNLLVYSWCLTERYEGLATHRAVTPAHENLPYWEELRNSGTGFVLVTAHLGHWEVGSAFPSDFQDRHVHVVREEEIDQRAQHFFEELVDAKSGGAYSVHFAHRDPNLGTRLLLAVRRGEVVALQGDRPARGGRTEELELFGRPFRMPVGPVAIARTAGVPILPVFVYRDGRLKARTIFREPIRVPKTEDRRADIRSGLESIVRQIEWGIRHRPYQWFCFRDFWEPR